ncbi:OmpA family protein [Actinoplanes awajinensis]|uniref:OmpA-like domain-containing protein n=1 Tax=Actinoplanes awajinensis subsp. mycoplanecinus TaxID=135947 RepID=A0A101JJ89_9ACTN|nr:OmpA family protein [Actinoplanes awajinensis]KUL27823.1 hypothetical protein ADL15_33860 [Actinoplanes awajinensis subsp. mycoplanecinus]
MIGVQTNDARRRPRFTRPDHAGVRRLWFAALIAVIGLAALLTVQLGPQRHRIENDLTDRATRALAAAGQQKTEVSFTGRDAEVNADSPAEADRARTVVAAVTGVRTVHTRVVPAAPVRIPPTFLLVASQGHAVLTGTVADAELRTALHDATAAAFGPAGTDDRFTVADTVTADPTLTGLPSLLRLLPARAATFSVRWEAGALTLTGTTPAETVHTALTAAAQRLGAPVTDRMTVAALQPQLAAVPPLTFRTDGATLTPESRKSLRTIADLLAANPSATIRVDGHTDSRGPKAMNLALSRDRADAVRTGLIEEGVAADRLTVAGHGEAQPKVANDTPEHRAMNRRVDLTVTR